MGPWTTPIKDVITVVYVVQPRAAVLGMRLGLGRIVSWGIEFQRGVGLVE